MAPPASFTTLFRAAILAPAFTPGLPDDYPRKQARSRAFSLRGLSQYGLSVMRNPLQPLVCRAPRMMLTLIRYVFNHPRQITSTKTHDSITGLPLQRFRVPAQPLIHVVRRPTLQLADEIAYE